MILISYDLLICDIYVNESNFICCYYKLNQATEDSEMVKTCKEQFQKEWAKLDARGEQHVNLTQHLGEFFPGKRSGKSVGHDESYLSNEKT